LSAYAGQNIELRLRALSEPAAPGEKPPQAPRPRRPAAQDADAPAAPPTSDGAINIGGPSVALWGNPVILRQVPDTKVPYNVLFIVIDALRPDVIASFHDDQDDAAIAKAPHAPLEAALPKVPGLVPHIDALAEKGVRFMHAYSGGAWTRPGTLSMLSGMRSSELGVGTLSWVIPQPEVARYYAQDPPLLPLLLRKEAVVTRAFVNNYFMVGYAPVGVDMGFERVDDHRYRTRDTLEITRDAIKWIKANKDQRFFAFCNYNSPHEPWEPPAEYLPRVPPPPVGPKDRITRLYMAEAAKDDEAVGALMDTLKELSLLERTIVVLTADHGETLSAAHGGVGLDKMQIRYHHAVSNFEETTRIPILIVAPGLLPAGKTVKARVRNTDIVPTLLDLLGLEPNAKMSGKSMVKLARGEREADERVVVSEGRGTRGLIFGRHRLLVRDGAAQSAKAEDGTGGAPSDELFDLETDPGERVNIGPKNPDLVKEMRARLSAAIANVPVAGSQAARSTAKSPAETDPRSKLQLRFVGAGASKRVSGKLKVSKGRFASIEAVGLDAAAARSDGLTLDLGFATAPTAPVGFDIALDSPQATVEWELFYDDQPLAPAFVHGGRYGLHFPQLQRGLGTDDARAVAGATQLPEIDPLRDYGLFVIRERKGGAVLDVAPVTGEGADEMNRLLEEWGYASGPKKKK
jgi:arylsulfatase A-like enzyme